MRRGEGRSRGIRAKLAAKGVAFVCRDLSLGNELSHLISHASGKVPHITVPLLRRTRRTKGGCFSHLIYSNAINSTLFRLFGYWPSCSPLPCNWHLGQCELSWLRPPARESAVHCGRFSDPRCESLHSGLQRSALPEKHTTLTVYWQQAHTLTDLQ